jgi:hypothetical protein
MQVLSVDRIHHLLLSVYSAFLFDWVEETRPFAWSTQGRFKYFWHPHAVALTRTDGLIFDFELYFVPFIIVYLIVAIARRFPFGRALLRTFGGIMAVTSFPVIFLYRRYNPSSPIIVTMLLLAVTCFLLWVARKWPVSTPVSIFLLIFYYALCSLFGDVNRPVNQLWASDIWPYSWLLFPVAGFSYSLAWAIYFRRSEPATSRAAH